MGESASSAATARVATAAAVVAGSPATAKVAIAAAAAVAAAGSRGLCPKYFLLPISSTNDTDTDVEAVGLLVIENPEMALDMDGCGLGGACVRTTGVDAGDWRGLISGLGGEVLR